MFASARNMQKTQIFFNLAVTKGVQATRCAHFGLMERFYALEIFPFYSV